MPKLTPLHRLAKAYWDAHYTGMTRVGLPPKDKPRFRAGNDVENETMRSMRWAVEELKDLPVEAFIEAANKQPVPGWDIGPSRMRAVFDAVVSAAFPEPLTQRSTKLTGNDVAVKDRAGAKFG